LTGLPLCSITTYLLPLHHLHIIASCCRPVLLPSHQSLLSPISPDSLCSGLFVASAGRKSFVRPRRSRGEPKSERRTVCQHSSTRRHVSGRLPLVCVGSRCRGQWQNWLSVKVCERGPRATRRRLCIGLGRGNRKREVDGATVTAKSGILYARGVTLGALECLSVKSLTHHALPAAKEKPTLTPNTPDPPIHSLHRHYWPACTSRRRTANQSPNNTYAPIDAGNNPRLDRYRKSPPAAAPLASLKAAPAPPCYHQHSPPLPPTRPPSSPPPSPSSQAPTRTPMTAPYSRARQQHYDPDKPTQP